MPVNDLFKKVPVEVPNKSGFDMSHQNVFSTKCGTLTPSMVDMLLPNDTISLSVGSEIQLPPMATDFYGRVKGVFEAFFVPFRVLYGGWQDLITHPTNGANWPAGVPNNQKATFLPSLKLPTYAHGVGKLLDYLGFETSVATDIVIRNPLRMLAYHKIYDDWYRDSRIQAPAFKIPNPGAGTPASPEFSQLPYITDASSSPVMIDGTSGSAANCADGVPCYNLRQRNWARDYFTNSTPKPQAGDSAALGFTVNTNTGAGSFTIESLRAANSLQKWMERNNIAGYRYGDQIRAQFGIYPSDAALDRALYLGRQIVDVYNKSVYQSAPDNSTPTNNPFASQGAKYASSLGVGGGQLVDKFTASEHGYIFVMFSLVPDAIYSAGCNREFGYNTAGHFPFPLLAGVGDQPVFKNEMQNNNFDTSLNNWGIFGYTQRYANHKFMNDEVHGLLKDGSSLQSFALQRSFVYTQLALGSSFLQIPTNYMDNVTAVSSQVSTYGCWVDSAFNYHKISTLPAYSIPTLGDEKNTHTEVIPNGGTRL